MDRAARKPILPVAGCLLAVLLCSMASADAAGAPVAAHDDPAEVARVADLVDAGQFAAAEQRIAAHGSLPAAGSEHALAFQRERMRRLRLDFSLDTGAAKAAVRRAIPDLRDEEFERWDRLGLLEHLDIDGARFYFKRAPGNLLRLSDQARARQPAGTAPPSEGTFEALTPYHAQVVQAASNTGKAYVLPQRVEVTQSLTVKADAVPAGAALGVWIPYPRDIPGQQTQIQWRGSTPGQARIAPPSTLQRTAYLQGTAVAGQPTRFEIRYALTVAAQHTRIDPARVQPTPSDPALAPYLAEQPPHVRFTPALRLFSDQVLQGETRPAEIARLLFDAVDRIPWAGAREYSTLTNISDYALRAGHADCGQQTLLLITLLRMNGIPARWQSGMVFADDAVGYNNLHDWGALYLAAYGWVPMDVTTGRLHSADPALRDFYFGGLDAYRIAFNDAFSQPLVPAKRFARSDTVDSQRGEVEWDGGNLYFDQWNYDFQSHIVPLDATR